MRVYVEDCAQQCSLKVDAQEQTASRATSHQNNCKWWLPSQVRWVDFWPRFSGTRFAASRTSKHRGCGALCKRCARRASNAVVHVKLVLHVQIMRRQTPRNPSSIHPKSVWYNHENQRFDCLPKGVKGTPRCTSKSISKTVLL